MADGFSFGYLAPFTLLIIKERAQFYGASQRRTFQNKRRPLSAKKKFVFEDYTHSNNNE